MTNEEQDLYYGWMFASPIARLKVMLRLACVIALWLIGLGVCLGIIIKVALAVL